MKMKPNLWLISNNIHLYIVHRIQTKQFQHLAIHLNNFTKLYAQEELSCFICYDISISCSFILRIILIECLYSVLKTGGGPRAAPFPEAMNCPLGRFLILCFKWSKSVIPLAPHPHPTRTIEISPWEKCLSSTLLILALN